MKTELKGRQWWAVGVCCLLALTGCSGFFVPTSTAYGTGTGGGTTPPTTTSLAYVANTVTNTVSGFNLGSGTLTSVPSMPYLIGFTPQAAVVSRANSYLYVAGPGAIYAYLIGADGSLSAPASGAGVVIVNCVSLDVSPDGNWLFGLDGTTTQLDVYQITPSTGGLTLVGAVPYAVTNAQVVPKMVKVSPDGTLVFASLGTGGDAVFTFNTSNGTALLSQMLAPVSLTTSDNGLAVDKTSTHLYIARSGTSSGMAVYTIGAAGALTSVKNSPFAAGTQPLAVVLDSTSSYAYVANGSGGTISGFGVSSIATGVVTALNGSPYASGVNVRSLGVDSTGKYLLAVGFGGSPDLTMYSFDATVPGKLDQVATSATGTDPAGAVTVALSH